jgi:hypothetical protein
MTPRLWGGTPYARRLPAMRFSESIETPGDSCTKTWSDPFSYTISLQQTLVLPISQSPSPSDLRSAHSRKTTTNNNGAPQGAPFDVFWRPHRYAFTHRTFSTPSCHPIISVTSHQVQFCGHPGEKGCQEGFIPQPSYEYSTPFQAPPLTCDTRFRFFLDAVVIRLKPDILQSWQL